ncbi:retron Ec67 family RNA-directed DNA polymerase/endonuclease [uncultured Desulfosarcina sp.]|uniref:retron Ec67 family RNA-directed DNA polymerase/endonuclease n=1 Tax=uncultured Desulfosarcina sp. TaxID=218289 RepID=UPI0029C6B827|nr:retron Ec67 family RNA-directed DNA polymerase/endonuclease [uncultured Desulfosarcina sp.]
MSRLEELKFAASRSDVAKTLGFKPKALSYILFHKKTPNYNQFEIPKRKGNYRLICAPCPELKKLQRRLSVLLQDCIDEINKSRNIKSAISHGFRRKFSIVTNASIHRKKRYVFNIDLENFFGVINFGRVRGFFIKNQNFKLNSDVATVIAQIACHNNFLPQGSPCSPVISNLIAHILDIRLAALANRVGCSYSRYADDLTFSTNKRCFPGEVAVQCDDENHHWKVSDKLEYIIKKQKFEVNHSKTRMQYKDSRQDVTGLVVNTKINARVEYRRTARAMVHRLLNKGTFQRKETEVDENGHIIESLNDGTIEQLNGILSFINSVNLINKKDADTTGSREKPKESDDLSCNEKVYRDFLLFKYFHSLKKPIIICEGKTDNIYLECAIKSLADKHTKLAEDKGNEGIKLKINFLKRTPTTSRILSLSGGTGELNNFITTLRKSGKRISFSEKKHPVILLIDNDSGAKKIFSHIKSIKNSIVNNKSKFLFVSDNLYVVPTPLTDSGKETKIEDFFKKSILKTEINGKKFNPSEKEFNPKTEYGKYLFAKLVIKKNQDKIDFSGFNSILDRIEAVLEDYKSRFSL